MTRKSPLPRLDDMHDAIAAIEEDTANLTYADFCGSRQKRWLVERGIEILSEASRGIPGSLKAEHPDIPWKKVAGVGNVLRHQYMSIAPDIVWAIVTKELGPLKRAVKAMIEKLEE